MYLLTYEQTDAGSAFDFYDQINKVSTGDIGIIEIYAGNDLRCYITDEVANCGVKSLILTCDISYNFLKRITVKL